MPHHASVNSSIPDLFGLYQRYGIRNNRVAFRNVFDVMDKMDITPEMEALADQMLGGAKACSISREFVLQDVKY